MQILFLILLFILGACFGSFLCCEARRLHAKNAKKKIKSKRSVCLSCGYQLKWYDNLPIISWLFLKGKCRKCHQKIGLAEIIAEFCMAVSFLAIGTTIDIFATSPLSWAIFIITLLLILSLGFLAIYDGIYGELPTCYLIISIIIAIIIMVLKETEIFLSSGFSASLIYNPLLSALILGGLYLLLYLISKGKWVGNGDWLLGLALGFALVSPWLALINLFLANLLACLVMAPFMKHKKTKKIYFGPFMVMAFVITLTFAKFFESML